MSATTDMLTSCLGLRVAGGCRDCPAYQTVAVDASGLWHLTIHHDDDCTTWMAIRTSSTTRTRGDA